MINFDAPEPTAIKHDDILPIDSSVCTNFVKIPLSSNIVNVSYNGPYTIVEWNDGTTTSVNYDDIKFDAIDIAIFKKYQKLIKGA